MPIKFSPIPPLAAISFKRFKAKYSVLPSGCWQWTAYLNPCGYGCFGFGWKVYQAHRVAYTHFVGPIPDGLTVDHLCRNRGCVNPSHMELVDLKTNCLRGDHRANNANLRKTHCPQGHPYDEINIYRDPRGHRQCKICGRAATHRSHTPERVKIYNQRQYVRLNKDPEWVERERLRKRLDARRRRKPDKGSRLTNRPEAL